MIIYRFSENLFFANNKVLVSDIENSIKEDTKVVILDASAINSLDITAADALEMLAASLKNVELSSISQNIPEKLTIR